MSKLIKIEIANPNALRVNFVMTRHCPYECRYCPDNLHYGKHQEINLKDLEEFLSRFKHRNGVLQITGGECTTHPQFKDVISVAKKVGFNTQVDSNSVRTLRFYNDVKDLVDNWCITLHPSQHTLDLEKLKLLAASSFLVVYVMMDPKHWETSIDWYNQVSQLEDLKVTPTRIMNNWAGATFEAEYTQEHLDVLSSLKSKWLFTKERETALRKTHMWLADTESLGTYDDGSKKELDVFSMIRKHENNFYGWSCSAGRESILIFDDGTAVWANCGAKRYEHFLEIYPEILDEPVKCKMLECTCATDVRCTKSKTSFQ